MIVRSVVCPHPPLLFRELTGEQDVAADLRAACVAAVRGLVGAAPERVVVVGGVDVSGPVPADRPVDVRGFGTTSARRAGPRLPLSLAVGRRLLDEAGWTGRTELVGLAWDAGQDEVDALATELSGSAHDTVLLLLGGGSACRNEKAPGFLDARAFGFDDTVATALEDGDAPALRAVDVTLARELLVDGRAVFRLLAAVAGDGPAQSTLSYRDDPFGVSYFVASWRLA